MSAVRGWWDRRSKRPLMVAAAALVAAGALAWVPAQASPQAADRAAAPAFTATKTLERVFVDEEGQHSVVTRNTVTVEVDQTRNLRGRQRVNVSWHGAQPSGGRASDPYGVNGMNQEYPVVVLQCRGLDDPALPAGKRLSPQTCWTNSVAQRSQLTRSESEATFTTDLYAAPADRERLSGVAPFPDRTACPIADIDPYVTHLTPFRARSGKVSLACDSATMPPEAAVGAAYPAAEVAAFTDSSGDGSVKFEVRSDVENESLGCSDKVACSIVVIPINGISCARPQSPPSLADRACRQTGRFLPGSSNGVGSEVDQAVSPALWWSESNWRNRFSVPITFGLPPDTCTILDPRPPTGFYGSELIAQAALQWAPAYCLDRKRSKFQHNQMSDEAGFTLMEKGGGAAAIVSSEHERKGDDPVGYAPTAVTGFAIGYVIDRPDNAGEYGDLRLNARLIAKLMTQSYLGSDLGRRHPGIGANPLALMNDPEFVALNPGLSRISQEAGAALLSLANGSDVVEQLTAYLASDRDAMAFVNGKADPWGMKVNPSYRRIKLPRSEWPLLDTYVPPTTNECRQKNPGVYFAQLAAPVTTLKKVAEAVLDGWPNVQTRCDFDQSTSLFKLGRIDRQPYGTRFILGVVSLGDAERYGLRTAALETRRKTFVAPSDASMSAALKLAKQGRRYEPFVLDQARVRTSRTAYPGTMVLYTAARLRNLPEEDAAKVARFIEVATTEGQRVGTGNGRLPAGFLPIRRTGVTRGLFLSAQEVAAAVRRQRPAAHDEPAAAPSAAEAPSAGGGETAPDAPGAAPPAADPGASPPPAAVALPGDAAPVAMPATEAISSRTARGIVPSLLVVGLLGIAIASLLRFLAPGRRSR